jgi:hypothetical protein
MVRRTRPVSYSSAVKRGTIEDAAADGTFRKLDAAVAEFIKSGATLDEIAGEALKVFNQQVADSGGASKRLRTLMRRIGDELAARDAGDTALRALLERSLKK